MVIVSIFMLDPDKTVSRYLYEITVTKTIIVSDRNKLYDSSGNTITDANGQDITSRKIR